MTYTFNKYQIYKVFSHSRLIFIRNHLLHFIKHKQTKYKGDRLDKEALYQNTCCYSAWWYVFIQLFFYVLLFLGGEFVAVKIGIFSQPTFLYCFTDRVIQRFILSSWMSFVNIVPLLRMAFLRSAAYVLALMSG